MIDHPLLSVSSLSVSFGPLRAVTDVSFDIAPGECFALVGESGSGKSVTARSLLGLSGGAVAASALRFDDVDLLTASKRRMLRLRGEDIGYVSQGALVALDPLRLVGREVGDALRLHTSLASRQRSDRVLELLSSVGIPDPAVRAGQRADELSGGLRQRALIASAIALRPRLLIADEPTTALDSTIAAGILTLLERLRDEGTAILLISHDLATVARLASRVAVMREGRIVETGDTASVLAAPRHPYTRALIAAVPTGVPRHSPLAPTPSAPEPAHSALPALPAIPALPALPALPAQNSGDPSGVAASREQHAAGSSASPEFRASRPALPALAERPAEPVLEAASLSKSFGERHAVDDVGFVLGEGRTLGIVGESGSGKTTVARILLGLERPDSGTVNTHGKRISAIYQDALSSFDPRWRVGRILGPRAVELLALVGLPPEIAERRPRLLSGGQQQRVGIARALARDPEIILCDEPVSSLDVSAQALILDLLDDLQRRLGLSYLFISHDLGVVRHMSDDVLVMRDGRVLESGPTERVFAEPASDYTRALIAAAPALP